MVGHLWLQWEEVEQERAGERGDRFSALKLGSEDKGKLGSEDRGNLAVRTGGTW